MKKALHNPLKKHVAQTLKTSITQWASEASVDLEQIYNMLTDAPNYELGHLAFPCFPLAKVLRTSPAEIATQLAKLVKQDDWIAQAKSQGPYLNIFLSLEKLGEKVVSDILMDEFFKRELLENPHRVMIEYSQPNTHKELHVGHMRNISLGNALVRMKSYVGETVIPVTYPGDVGTHVAKCLWHMKKNNLSPTPDDDKGAWLGTLYSTANNLLEDQKGTDKEEQNRIELTAILKQLHDQKGEYFDLWKETRDWSIATMNQAYAWADIKFDHWFWESVVDEPSVKLAKKWYDEGFYKESEGAVGIDLSDDKLGFCMVIKSDGNGLYATKDIMLAYNKFEEYNLDESYYCVDTRQALHFKQVFKVLEKKGFEHAKDCHHLAYNFVELPDGAMSSRKGNIVPLMELVRNMEGKIKTDYLERYRGEWSDQEIDETAKNVANGAIKYGMIRVDNNRKIVFDMNEWLKLDGETGPYLQYVHARINALCEKLGPVKKGGMDWNLLDHKLEKILLLKLMNFNDIAVDAALGDKTPLMCAYLYELGKMFNSFYAECSIGKAATPELKDSRLALAKAVGLVMKKGLETLGIPAPNKM